MLLRSSSFLGEGGFRDLFGGFFSGRGWITEAE